MNIVVSGSTGLIGSALVPFLTSAGHSVRRLVRGQPPGESAVRWSPAEGTIDSAQLEGTDAAIHLAGESIAGGRWTEEKKARILNSRVDGTRLLAEALGGLERRPGVFVCASAIGYYGDRGDELLDEASRPGGGFLAEVCKQWEAAADPARSQGIRVVHLRFGMVLSAAGGALQQMLLPYKLGLGGRIGSGRQHWSWIALNDAVGAIHHALVTDALEGPANAVSPYPVTSREFTKTLGRVLRRPTLLPMPSPAARLVFGQMADELLLASQRVTPRRLLETGYVFQYPDLEDALRHLLGRTGEG
ncbi:MAG: TIGR01777 family oxidoreductase [Pirellulales bacterium]